jgi:hypothetical protein
MNEGVVDERIKRLTKQARVTEGGGSGRRQLKGKSSLLCFELSFPLGQRLPCNSGDVKRRGCWTLASRKSEEVCNRVFEPPNICEGVMQDLPRILPGKGKFCFDGGAKPRKWGAKLM